MPTKWLQERAKGSKNEPGMPPLRAFCGMALEVYLDMCESSAVLAVPVQGYLADKKQRPPGTLQ